MSGNDALAVGLSAYYADRQEFAEQAWGEAAHAGNHEAEFYLGVLLEDQNRDKEAEGWYRKAADGAEPVLATILRCC